MIKAVILDFRDTLIRVDRSYRFSNTVLFTFVRRHRTISRTEFDERINRAVASVITRRKNDPSVHDWSALFIRRLLINANILVSYRESATLLRDYHRAFAAHAALYPEARAILQKLKKQKIKIALVIDGTVSRERAIIRRLGLQKYIAVVVISEQVGKNKFTSLPLRQAIKRLKVKPAELLVVGDRIDKDIIHANRLGCASAKLERKTGRYATTKSKKKIEQPDYVIRSLKEVLSLVRV